MVVPPDVSSLTDDELYKSAQAAGEKRISFCDMVELEGEALAELEFPGEETCGLYCGCITCMVREVLDAAQPFLRELGRRGPNA